MSGNLVMICLGYADGSRCESVGQYLIKYEPNYAGGLGRAWWTHDPKLALKFDNFGEMHEFWRQVSTARPKRADGKPNRPLAAFSYTPGDIEDLNDDGLQKMIEIARKLSG